MRKARSSVLVPVADDPPDAGDAPARVSSPTGATAGADVSSRWARVVERGGTFPSSYWRFLGDVSFQIMKHRFVILTVDRTGWPVKTVFLLCGAQFYLCCARVCAIASATRADGRVIPVALVGKHFGGMEDGARLCPTRGAWGARGRAAQAGLAAPARGCAGQDLCDSSGAMGLRPEPQASEGLSPAPARSPPEWACRAASCARRCPRPPARR